jgi:hypothetical protein
MGTLPRSTSSDGARGEANSAQTNSAGPTLGGLD